MNNYVSAKEKAQLIRVILMRDVLQDAIDVYAGLDSTDKAFLAELRHGRTRIEKAVKLRRLALENDADDKLLAGVAKLEPMFLARPEAKKAHKEIMELQSTLPMDVEDLQDWYGFVIDFTCKNCTKADYSECPARRVLTKYEICPIDPGAKGKCQYSYADDTVVVEPSVPGMIENPEFAELGNVSLQEHSAVKNQVEDLQAKVIEWENAYCANSEKLETIIKGYEKFKAEIVDILYPDIDDCQDNLKLSDIVDSIRDMDKEYDILFAEKTECVKESNMLTERIKDLCEGDEANAEKELVHEDDSLPVFLGLNNGTKLEMSLPESMAKNLITEVQRPRLSRSICAKYVAGEFVAIDLQEVVAMRVSGLVGADYIKPQLVQAQSNSINERGRFRVECYCGAEYFADMFNGFREGRKKARCNVCNEDVFIDPQADKLIDPKDGAEAVLLTNRYFVASELRKPQQSVQESEEASVPDTLPQKTKEVASVTDLRDIKNVGRGYKDPCQLFGSA